MPLPNKEKDEKPSDFMHRCMNDDNIKNEFPNKDQRLAVCLSKACEGLNYVQSADLRLHVSENYDEYVATEVGEVEGAFKYKHPDTNQLYYYDRQGIHKKGGRTLIYLGKVT